MAEVLFERGWLEPAPHSRAVLVTKPGARALNAQLGLVLDGHRSPDTLERQKPET